MPISNLPIYILDTQNYIAASDIVISKADWIIIVDRIIDHTSLVLVEIPSVRKDSFNI